MRTLVLGLGNPILSDDGVGPRVAAEVRSRINGLPDVTVLEASTAGLDSLDLLSGYDKVVLIDAIQTDKGKAGQVYRLDAEALVVSRHVSTPHDVNLATALELGKRLGMPLPRTIVIYAVEVEDVTTFSERCTPEVAQSIPVVAKMVVEELLGEGDSQDVPNADFGETAWR